MTILMHSKQFKIKKKLFEYLIQFWTCTPIPSEFFEIDAFVRS